MIDLHLHTNASDGRCTPSELVARASVAGLTVIAVTDHDTVASIAEASVHAASAGVRLIAGIEITAVWHDLDVHVLGYGFDRQHPALTQFLAHQRADRLRRVRSMIERLRDLGAPIDESEVFRPVAGRSPDAVGRPQVARAMVRAGHVTNADDAFERYLGEGRPAYISRIGSTPAEVVRLIVEAGGVASLAHPGLLGHDELIPDLVAAGLQALEAYHPDHDALALAHYRDRARHHRIAVTGGSDYHADGAHGAMALGAVSLPNSEFPAFDALLGGRRA